MRATTSLPTPLSPLMKIGTSTGRDLQDLLADLEHLRAGGQEGDVLRESLAVFPQRLVFRTELLLLPALQEGGIEFRLFERLRQVIERADPDRLDDRGHFIRAREHDDVERAVHLHQLPQRLQPVHLRHQHVENDEVRPLAFTDTLQGFLAAGQRLDFESIHFEQRPEILPDARLVVHDHDLFFDLLFSRHRYLPRERDVAAPAYST